MKYMLAVLLVLLLPACFLPACAREKPVLVLPTGERLVPFSALEKLQVKRQGDVIMTLIRGKAQAKAILDATIYNFMPATMYTGELYLPASDLEALNIRTKATKTSLKITANGGKTTLTVTCPLRVLPLTPKTAGCHPIVDFYDWGGWLIGGLCHGSWRFMDVMVNKMPASDTYRLYSLDTYLGTTRTERPLVETPADDEGGGYGYSLSNPSKKTALGIACTWDALPRKPKVQDTTQATYIKEVERIVAAYGIVHPTVIINQLLRVDLDGDGTEEVLLNAQEKEADAAPEETDSFCLVAVRKLINGTVHTFLLRANFSSRQIDSMPFVPKYEIAGVLDVDGDKQQEIIIREEPGGAATNIYVYKYASAHYWNVLVGGWGD